MKISTLITREPFDKIFADTLKHFLFDSTGTIHSVIWNDKKMGELDTNNNQTWYCNPHINSIFVKNVDPMVFTPINGEYLKNTIKPWKSVFQKHYLKSAQSDLLRSLLAKHKIYISPPLSNAKNTLIIGGNNKIRILDIKNKLVWVILKNGFDKKYIKREILVRSKFDFLHTTKVIKISTTSDWYCENLVVGIPPNRLDKEKKSNIFNRAAKNIHLMLNKTKKNVSLLKYFSSLTDSISLKLKEAEISKNAELEIKNLINNVKSSLPKDPKTKINTATCHGDYHPGNILSNGEDFWILDWEHSSVKQIGYDLITFLLESRISNGFDQRFNRLANNEFASNIIDIAKKWPGIDWYDSGKRKTYLLLYLIEDIDFYLDEYINPLFYKNPSIMDNRVTILTKSFKALSLVHH